MSRLLRPGFGVRLLSTLLCIALFACMLSGILIANVRIATTKENTSKIIREALFTSHTLRPASQRPAAVSGHGSIPRPQTKLAMAKLAEEDTNGVMTDALVEMFYETMSEQYGDLPITLEEVEEFVDKSTLKDELSDISASLVNDLITGENTTVIDEELVTGIMMDNADLIEEYFDVVVEEEAVKEMADALVNNEVVQQIQKEGIAQVILGNANREPNKPGDVYDEEELPDGSTGSIGNVTDPLSDLPRIMETMRTALSQGTMIGCFAGAAVCIALLLLLNRRWIWYPMRRIGWSFIWAALPLAIPTAMVLGNSAVFAELLAEAALIGTVLGMILTMAAPVNLGVAGVGVVLVIASAVLKSSAKKRLAAAVTVNTGAVLASDIPTPETPDEPETEEEPVEEEPEEPEEPEEKVETQEDIINDIRNILGTK